MRLLIRNLISNFIAKFDVIIYYVISWRSCLILFLSQTLVDLYYTLHLKNVCFAGRVELDDVYRSLPTQNHSVILCFYSMLFHKTKIPHEFSQVHNTVWSILKNKSLFPYKCRLIKLWQYNYYLWIWTFFGQETSRHTTDLLFVGGILHLNS